MPSIRTKVFLTVGTHPEPFDRLVKEMDRISKTKKFEVFGQTGNSAYIPKNFVFARLLNTVEYSQKAKWADIIVSHGGAGAIIHAMEHKKKLVVVPRLKDFSEHTNNHQLDLARVLEKHKKAISLENIQELEVALQKAKSFSPQFDSTKKNLITGIANWLSALEKN